MARIRKEVTLYLESLVECGSIDNLNNMVETMILNGGSDTHVLEDITYRPVKVMKSGSIVINVFANKVKVRHGNEKEV